MNECKCKYAQIQGTGVTCWYECRLEGGSTDPNRCAGCGWRKEE